MTRLFPQLWLLSAVFVLCSASTATDVSVQDLPSDKELESAIAGTLADPVEETTVPPADAAPIEVPLSPLSLADSFSSEKNPGRGTISYLKADQNEVIDLGTASGHFGYGLVFRASTLPEQFIRENGAIDVIQFSFGTLASRLEGRVPEFGTMAIFTRNKPQDWKPFPFSVGMQRQPGQEYGVMVFTSPTSKANRSDEDLMRGSFFAKSGQVRVKSTGSSQGLDVDAQGKKVSFKVQAMKLEINAELSTPLNPQKHQLQANVEVPVYWPESPAALSWMKRIALQSLLASNTVTTARNSASSEAAPTSNKSKRSSKTK